MYSSIRLLNVPWWENFIAMYSRERGIFANIQMTVSATHDCPRLNISCLECNPKLVHRIALDPKRWAEQQSHRAFYNPGSSEPETVCVN